MKETEKKQSESSRFYKPVPTIIITLLLFLIPQIVFGVVLGGALALLGWSEARINDWIEVSAFAQFMFSLLVSVSIIAVILALLRQRNIHPRFIGVRRPRIKDVGWALLAYGWYILMFIVITIIAKQLVPALDLEQEQFNFDAINRTTVNLALLGLTLMVLPPIMEEILCRGFLYTGLRNKLKPLVAAIITSCIFAAAHLQIGNGAPLLWVAAIDTFILSMVLVYLREKTGSLVAPILLHALKNSVAFIILFFVM
jgi:membrane protease YdiL (CAAX protease family)